MAQLNRRYINLNEIQEILEQNEILSEENKQLKEQNTELWLFVEHCKKVLTNTKKQGEQLGKQETEEQDAKQTGKGQSSISKKSRMAKLQKAEDARTERS